MYGRVVFDAVAELDQEGHVGTACNSSLSLHCIEGHDGHEQQPRLVASDAVTVDIDSAELTFQNMGTPSALTLANCCTSSVPFTAATTSCRCATVVDASVDGQRGALTHTPLFFKLVAIARGSPKPLMSLPAFEKARCVQQLTRRRQWDLPAIADEHNCRRHVCPSIRTMIAEHPLQRPASTRSSHGTERIIHLLPPYFGKSPLNFVNASTNFVNPLLYFAGELTKCDGDFPK